MSQTTRPAPAALSNEILAEHIARLDWALSKAWTERQLTHFEKEEIRDMLAELSRLRAGLTQAPELIEKLRDIPIGPQVAKQDTTPCDCHVCTIRVQAADLLSSLLPQDDTRKEPTHG